MLHWSSFFIAADVFANTAKFCSMLEFPVIRSVLSHDCAVRLPGLSLCIKFSVSSRMNCSFIYCTEKTGFPPLLKVCNHVASSTVFVQELFCVQPLSSFQTDGNLEAATYLTHQYQEVYIWRPVEREASKLHWLSRQVIGPSLSHALHSRNCHVP